jgi:hypothetical protein
MGQGCAGAPGIPRIRCILQSDKRRVDIVPVCVPVPVPGTKMLSGTRMVLPIEIPGCLRALQLPMRFESGTGTMSPRERQGALCLQSCPIQSIMQSILE